MFKRIAAILGLGRKARPQRQRETAWEAFQATQRRGDTRAQGQAWIDYYRATHDQLAAEVGKPSAWRGAR